MDTHQRPQNLLTPAKLMKSLIQYDKYLGLDHGLLYTRENLSLVVCEQQRRRPACASVQTGQRLCYLRFG